MTGSYKNIAIKSISTLVLLATATLSLSGCATIEQMGQIGPNKVYSVSNSSFLSSSQMIIVMNKKGDVSAYTGGTVPGIGAVGLQTGATVLTAGAIAVAGRAIEHGLETTNVRTTGIPSTFNVKGTLNTTNGVHIDTHNN